MNGSACHTSQASGYGLTQRMIAGLSLGAALAAALYYETRRKQQATRRDAFVTFHISGTGSGGPVCSERERALTLHKGHNCGL